MKDQFVGDEVHFDIKNCQMYIHAKEVVEAYHQAHGFNDDGH
jgi:hypothetical protein